MNYSQPKDRAVEAILDAVERAKRGETITMQEMALLRMLGDIRVSFYNKKHSKIPNKTRGKARGKPGRAPQLTQEEDANLQAFLESLPKDQADAAAKQISETE